MKKLLLIFSILSISCLTAWAVDVNVVETYQTMPNIYNTNETASLSGGIVTASGQKGQGVLGIWNYRYVRSRTNKNYQDLLDGSRAFVFDRSANTSKTPYLQCNEWEGGIKSVSFKWQQVSADDDGQQLKLQVMIKETGASDKTQDVNVTAGETYRSVQNYTSNATIDSKAASCQLIIYNKSMDAAGTAVAAGRFKVGNLTITPYLLYRNKEVTIGSKQKGYVNNDLIDNTESGTITYSSDDEGVATIDGDGVITPVAAGDAVITASWSEGVTTTYTLHVVDGIIVENFSKVLKERPDAAAQEQNGATWEGDLFDWNVRNVRRGADDTIGLSPRKQATAMRLKSGANTYLETPSEIEGGIKHVQFNYRQWASASGTLTLSINYGKTNGSWDTPSIEESVAAATASTSHEFNKDIDDGSKGNNLMRLKYSVSGDDAAGHIVIENIKITPWLLYTTKEVTLNTLSAPYKNNDLIDNTGGEGNINYSSTKADVATVDNEGNVVVVGPGMTEIKATWGNVSTQYTLYVEGVLFEDFAHASTAGVSTSRTSYMGNYTEWWYRNSRSKTSDVLKDERRAFWLSPEASNNNTYIETTIDGGVKHIAFDWRQFDKGQNGYKFNVKINNTSYEELTFTGADSYVDNDQSFSKMLSIKQSNLVLTIKNVSTNSDGETAGGKILIGPIAITPYLQYIQKWTKSMQVNETYTNPSLINNTYGENGTLSFETSNSSVATVNSSTGEVTAKTAGTATITAKFAWAETTEVVATTYQVRVLPPCNYETFNSAFTNNYYATNDEIEGDNAKWTTRLGGFNSLPEAEPNSAYIRAPRQNTEEEAYIESNAIAGGIASMTFEWNLVGWETNTNWDIRVLINGREVHQFVTTPNTPKGHMATSQQISISDINEPGNFVIRFENRSTIEGEYTSGNKGRFVIDNIFWESYDAPIGLNANADNSAILARNNDATVDVSLTNRSLVADVWNTLCLPFAISQATLGEGVDVQQMSSANLEGEDLIIGFTALNGDLQAGMPYLVKPTSNVQLNSFTNKTIIAEPLAVTKGIATLTGIFSPEELTADDKTTLFVGVPDGEGNNLFYPSETGNLNGFRAYFKINEATPGAGAPPIKRARFVVNQPQTPTDIDQLSNGQSPITNKIMRDGQLIIIRDGIEYNAMGQVIQFEN